MENEEELLQKEDDLDQPQLVEDTTDYSNRAKQNYNAPFGNDTGKSSIDLTQEGANERMLEERSTYLNLPLDDPNREGLKEAFYDKYYGTDSSSFEASEMEKFNNSEPYSHLRTIANAFATPGYAIADFGMDAIGALGGDWGRKLDDRWDETTRFDNEVQ